LQVTGKAFIYYISPHKNVGTTYKNFQVSRMAINKLKILFLKIVEWVAKLLDGKCSRAFYIGILLKVSIPVNFLIFRGAFKNSKVIFLSILVK
jgi:hypothetical protein